MSSYLEIKIKTQHDYNLHISVCVCSAEKRIRFRSYVNCAQRKAIVVEIKMQCTTLI